MITRLTEFRAQPGKEDALKEFLQELVPRIKAIAGCLDCSVLQSSDDAARFLVREQWTSIEAHAESIKNIPPDLMMKAMTLLAGMPKGEYWN